MAGTRTLTIIKPDAFGSGTAGKIVAHLESAGFRVLTSRVMHLSTPQAEAFYEVHKARPFFKSLVSFMTTGPCMPMTSRPPASRSSVADYSIPGAFEPAPSRLFLGAGR